MQIHLPLTETDIHSPLTGMEIHSPLTGMKIHSPLTEMKIHSPSPHGVGRRCRRRMRGAYQLLSVLALPLFRVAKMDIHSPPEAARKVAGSASLRATTGLIRRNDSDPGGVAEGSESPCCPRPLPGSTG